MLQKGAKGPHTDQEYAVYFDHFLEGPMRIMCLGPYVEGTLQMVNLGPFSVGTM